VSAGWIPSAWGRLGAVAPVPFAGTATILVALIIFTPVLMAIGPSPLAARAELVIYRVVSSSTTDFYVHGVGPDVPYSEVALYLGTGPIGVGSCPTARLNWTGMSQANTLGVSVTTNATRLVVNVTAVYGTGASKTVYAAEIAFAIVHVGASDEGLDMAVCPSTPGVTVPSSWSTANLPLAVLLGNFGSGGP